MIDLLLNIPFQLGLIFGLVMIVLTFNTSLRQQILLARRDPEPPFQEGHHPERAQRTEDADLRQ